MKFFGITWQKVLLLAVIAVLAYYPVSVFFSEEIDRSETIKFDNLAEEQSQGVEMMSFLINREINEHLWVPNLPYFFPASCLDNMPNFQMGILQALAIVAEVLPQQVSFFEGGDYVENIAKLLDYPADVWILANDENFKIAPSSTRKYRKALKLLRRLNDDLGSGKAILSRDITSVASIVEEVDKVLKKSLKKIDEEVREGEDNWFDTKVDDVFYFSVGQVYACALMLEKFGKDYKKVLADNDIYQEWTILIKNLQKAASINPKIVVNGKLDDALRANHLVYMGYYIAKARNILGEINDKIGGISKNEN